MGKKTVTSGSTRSSIHRAHGGSLAESEEADLIARLRDRDMDALGDLYRRLGGAMTTLARSMLRDRDEADDAVVQTLMKIRESAPRFRGQRGLKTWTLRILANHCRDLLRRRRFVAGRPEEMDPLLARGLVVEPEREWDAAIDRATAMAALEQAIGELPPEQREAVILRDRLGLSYQEVAETLGVSEASIKSRLFRARETLKRKLRSLL